MYTELNRTFADYLATQEYGPDYFPWFHTSNGLKWDDLLKWKYIVILGEAGSGKTSELENRSKILSSEGKLNLFCKMEDLIDSGLMGAIPSIEEKDKFEFWRKTKNEELTLFLDSLDEAKLKNLFLEKAILKIRSILRKEELTRLKIIISCRVSDWRPQRDKEILDNYISEITNSNSVQGNEITDPYISQGSDDKNDHDKLKIVTLAPLNEEQIVILAKGHGLNDESDFIKEINRADCWHYCQRPQDVLWITEYWKKYRKIDSLSDLIENNIKSKLIEINPSHESSNSISTEKIRIGCELLAAASTMCKKTHIAISEEIDLDRETESLNAFTVLKDWKNSEIKSLLSRAIFDEATYGRVKFHHRSISEFLTAKWFAATLSYQMPYHKVHNIIFQEKYGVKVVPENMRPVIGWLALWNERILSYTKDFFPEILIMHGDPQKLPIDIKAETIRKFAEKYNNQKRTGFYFDSIYIRRFASSDLSDVSLQLLDKTKESALRVILLNMIKEGRYRNCVNKLFSIIQDRTENDHIRAISLSAIKSIGDNTFIQKALKYFTINIKSLPPLLVSSICEELYPKYLSTKELFSFINTSFESAESDNSNDDNDFMDSLRGIPQVLEQLVGDIKKANLLEEIIRESLNLLGVEMKDGQIFYNKTYLKLGQSIELSFIRLLTEFSNRKLDDDLIYQICQFLRVHKDATYYHKNRSNEIKQAINARIDIKRMLFWKEVNQQKVVGENPSFCYDPYRPWDISSNDVSWLIIEVDQKSDQRDKLLVYNVLLDIWSYWGKNQDLLKKIKVIASTNIQFDKLLKDRLKIIRSNERRIIRTQQRISKSQQKNKAESLHSFKVGIISNIDKIMDGSNFGLIYLIYQHLQQHNSRSNLTIYDYSLLNLFENDIVGKIYNGFKSFWKKWVPPLLHEKKFSSEIEHGVSVGLTGIQVCVLQGLHFSDLTEDEARICITYATRELNQFPDWVSDLAKAHPSTVKSILKICIEAEYAASKEVQSPCNVLAKISHSSQCIIDLCAPAILNLLRRTESEHYECMQMALRIIMTSGEIDRKELKRIVELKLRKSTGSFFIQWIELLLALNLAKGLDFIEKYTSSRTQKEATDFMIKLCSSLNNNWRFRSSFFDLNQSNNVIELDRFFNLAVKYIRPVDDKDHNGVYTPDSRDDAESFRDKIISRLSQIPGENTHAKLLELSKKKELKIYSDTLLIESRKRALHDAEPFVLNEEDMYKLNNIFRYPPRTTEELYNLILEKLEEIKKDIEGGDFSLRDLFHSDLNEDIIQKWFADRLRTNSNQQYIVIREEEVDMQKKPDIRIWKNDVGPISLEIKCSHKWTYKELEGALKNQLVKQYLKDRKSNYGILLLSNMKEKTWKIGSSTKKHTLDDIANLLEKKARVICNKDSKIHGLKVIFIDFTCAK